MSELRHLLDDLAGSPAPAPRATSDALFDAGRRRHRRRTVVATALATVPILAVGAAIVWLPERHTAPPPADNSPSPSVSTRTVTVGWAEVADSQHAYARAANTIFGTDDGGRTWTARSSLAVQDVTALSVGVVLTRANSSGDDSPPMRLSTDGGRTFADLADESATVPAVPAGAAVLCRAHVALAPCKLSAVDPQTRRISPLAHQPDLIMPSAYNLVDPFGQIQSGGDRIVVAGRAQNTGRPAVAFSDDRGRTWTTHAFTDLPCTKDCNESISVQSSADGTTLYAMVEDREIYEDAERGQLYVYSKHLDGSWTRTGDVIAYTRTESFYRSFVAADGTLFVGTSRTLQVGQELNYLELRNGHFAPADLDGLSPTAMPVRRNRSGDGYFALDTMAYALYQSSDGRHWTKFPLMR
ncbi:hypothetical protein [Dactylosporangium sp. NPDC006015]|uniref:hypothetical protein n=1 Tax=Dactylosporangium sp. NPDC006015 TaxID=3154576 RepID=UPI0033B3309C